jgi:hypothetical protein
MGGCSGIAARTDGREDFVDFFQPQGPTALPMRSDHVDASEAKLSQLPLLHGVGRYGDQHSDARGSCS